MIKNQESIIFYDVDGTLAEPFCAPPKKLHKLISSLDGAGVKQILCSGKSKDYLAGMARGLGINSTSYVVAENGAIIYDWRNQTVEKMSKASWKMVQKIKPKIFKLVKDYDYFEESKETAVTLFFKDLAKLPEIAEYLSNNLAAEGVQVKCFPDGAIDISFGENHKGIAVSHLIKKYHSESKIYTCGDGINDLEMLSIGKCITFTGAHPEVIKKVKEMGGIVAEGNGPEGMLEAMSRLVYENHLPETINHIGYINRSWGNWEVLAKGSDYKVKKMTVFPSANLSLQKHNYRSEHWFIFEGKAEINVNNKIINLSEGEDYFVPQNAIHTIKNPGKNELVIIEVQRGRYLGEDDIIRFE